MYAPVLEIMGTDGALDRVVKTELHLESLPRLDTEVDETLLLDPTRPDGGVGALELPLAELLRLARESVSRGDFFQGMRALGAEPGEEEEILKGLIEDGLLWEK